MKIILNKRNPFPHHHPSSSGSGFFITPHLPHELSVNGNYTTMRRKDFYPMLYAAINGRKMPVGWPDKEG